MGCCMLSRRDRRRRQRDPARARQTGNGAFDAYRADTLARLEAEHQAFLTFLESLRRARDCESFEAFLAERAASRRPGEGVEQEN